MNQICVHWICLGGRLLGPSISWTHKSIIFPSEALSICLLSAGIIFPLIYSVFTSKRDRVLPHHNDMLNVVSWCTLCLFDWTPRLPVILVLISWCNTFPSYHWLRCPNTEAVFHRMGNFKPNCQTIGAGELNNIE